MSKLNFFRRGTLLIPSGPMTDPSRMHLHVICTNPDVGGKQILVSISTYEEGDDETCILLKSNHAWLSKERSCVDYRYTCLRTHASLIEGVRQKAFLSKEDMNGQDFLRICTGIEKSPFTPGAMRNLYRRMNIAEAQARSELQSASRVSSTRPDDLEEID